MTFHSWAGLVWSLTRLELTQACMLAKIWWVMIRLHLAARTTAPYQDKAAVSHHKVTLKHTHTHTHTFDSSSAEYSMVQPDSGMPRLRTPLLPPSPSRCKWVLKGTSKHWERRPTLVHISILMLKLTSYSRLSFFICHPQLCSQSQNVLQIHSGKA